jgi:hypothetical protein
MLVAALFVLAGVLDVGPGVLDNLVHLGFGFFGLALASRPRGAHAYLIGGGVVYVLLWQFGTAANPAIIPFQTDNVTVHVSLVLTMIGVAMLSGSRTPATTAEHEVEHSIEHHLRPVRRVRLRAVPSRPPGRGDRRTPKQVAEAPKPLAVGCR